jgi:hypothetical protein
MNPSYASNLMASFYLWLDHELANVGQGYTATSGRLYPVQDYNFNGYNVYSSPFRQWVSDSDPRIGATVPSGVYINGTFRANDGTGVIINYNRGEVLVNPSIGTVNQITTQYSKKDFNLYYTDEREENLLFENNYSLAPKFRNVTGGLGPDDQPFPCIFLKNTSYENKGYAFGGQERTLTTVRCILLSDNMYLMDGAISVLSDAVRKVFPVLSPSSLPYNYYGGFKSGVAYQYAQLPAVAQNTNLAYIDRVTVSRLDEIRNKQINLKVVASMVDFEIGQPRYPRIYSSGLGL